MPLRALRRAAHNPKRHDAAAMTKSLDRFGYVAPMVLDEATERLVAGHGRLEALVAARDAGATPPARVQVTADDWLVPVIRGVRFASEADAAAYLIADNKLVELGGWDDAELAAMLRDLDGDVVASTGFSSREVDVLLRSIAEPVADPGAQVDRAAELQAKWGTARGQLWTVGRHRVLCGDATSAEDVARLMGGELARLIVTSPPYNQHIDEFRPSGMHREGDWVAKVERLAYADSLPEPEYQSQQRAAIELWFTIMADHGSVFYNHKNRYRDKRVVSPLEWLPGPFSLRQEIVWSRPGSVTQNARMFLPSDERIFWLYKGDDFYFDATTEIKTYSTVWDVALETNKGFAVAFPIELPSRCIRACSEVGDLLVDPYLGSGTTAIAAEQLDRRCYGIEIDPAFAAITLERLAGLGLTPALVP